MPLDMYNKSITVRIRMYIYMYTQIIEGHDKMLINNNNKRHKFFASRNKILHRYLLKKNERTLILNIIDLHSVVNGVSFINFDMPS